MYVYICMYIYIYIYNIYKRSPCFSNSRILCCKQVMKTEHFKSNQTNRTFRIFQKTTCKSNFIISLLECELCKIYNIWRYTYDVHFDEGVGGGGIRKKWDVIGPTGRPIFNFLLKKMGFGPWPDIMPSQIFKNVIYLSCEEGGGLFETGHPKSRGWKNFGRKWTRGGEVLKSGQLSWTSYVYDP